MGFEKRVYSRPEVAVGDRIRVTYASGGAPVMQSAKPPKDVDGIVMEVHDHGKSFRAYFGNLYGFYIVVKDLDEWEKVEDDG